MQSLRLKLSLAAAALLLSALACQALGGGEKPPEPPAAIVTATQAGEVVQPATPVPPTEEPQETPEQPAETETPEKLPTPGLPSAPTLPPLPPAAPGPESLDLESLPYEPLFSDYIEAIQMDMTWTDPDDAPQEAGSNYSYQQQTAPQQAWYLLFDDNNPFFPSRIESALIGQDGFSTADEMDCQVVAPEKVQELQPRDPFISLLQALTGEATRVEAGADLDGQPVDVYTLTAENFKPGAEVVLKGQAADSDGEFNQSVSTTIGLIEEGTTLEEAKLYLAQQGGYPALLEMSFSRAVGEEDALFAKSGTLMERTVVYWLTPEQNGDAPLLPPEGCEGAGSGGEASGEGGGNVTMADLPRPEQTENVIETSDTLMFETPGIVQEIVDFYNEEMEFLGWEAGEAITVGNLATLEYSLGAQTVTITIIDSGGQVMVTVVLE